RVACLDCFRQSLFGSQRGLIGVAEPPQALRKDIADAGGVKLDKPERTEFRWLRRARQNRSCEAGKLADITGAVRGDHGVLVRYRVCKGVVKRAGSGREGVHDFVKVAIISAADMP